MTNPEIEEPIGSRSEAEERDAWLDSARSLAASSSNFADVESTRETERCLSNWLLRDFFSSLSSRHAEPPTMSDDLAFLRRLAKLVVESIDAKIISTKEAEALLGLAVSKFVGNRLERVLILQSVESALDVGDDHTRCWFRTFRAPR